MADVDRAFVRIAEGLVHYRHAGANVAGHAKAPLPLYMVHAGPGSSAGLAPLIGELGNTRRVIAPDTLGNGDSAAPGVADPDLGYYADSVIRIMDALKLQKVDYYGAHTGGHIGIELLLRHPDRFRRMIFDGLGIWTPQERQDLLANYAPEMKPDDAGRQFAWAWQFVRDQSIHWPYFKRDPEHRLKLTSVGSAEQLHRGVVDVLKALTTYHNGYHAVFKQDTEARLRALKPGAPVLFMAGEPDPLTLYLDQAAALVPGTKKVLVKMGEGLPARVAAIRGFLDA